MEALHFDYQMEIDYSVPVHNCHFTIKCIPKDDARQRLLKMNISMTPETAYSFGEDSYHNRQIYGHMTRTHDRFVFHICGEVEILQSDYEEEAVQGRIGMYKFPSGRCVPGEELLAYFYSLDLGSALNTFEKCEYFMHRLHQDFAYEPCTTQVYTDAETAWRLRKGVCQDYAHIYIVLLRLAGIPARYVCGLIKGEGASHAWVEALCEGRWVGYDPTNDCRIGNGYIKLGDGRDASGCAINRGIMLGGGTQTQRINARVEER